MILYINQTKLIKIIFNIKPLKNGKEEKPPVIDDDVIYIGKENITAIFLLKNNFI